MASWNVPIIGDSLSDATRQYSDWQRVNLGTEAANIGRRNEAERYWNSQVAERDQEAFRRQQIEEQRRLNQEAIGRDQYRWETGRKDAAAYNSETAALERQRIAAVGGAQKLKDAQSLEEEANIANNLAQPIAVAGARLDAATEEWKAKTSALNTAVQSLTIPGLIKFDAAKGAKVFKAEKQADEAGDKVAKAAADEANAKAAELINAHALAENALESAQYEFKGHEQKLGSNLTWDRRNGQYVVLNLRGKPGKNEYQWTAPNQQAFDLGASRAAHAAHSAPPTWTPLPPAPTQPRPTATGNIFSSEAEARAAGRVDGDVIIVNGRRAQLTPD